MPKVLLDCLSHEIFWGFLRICLFFKTVPMYFSSCQKLFIYIQTISESLGMMADTALSSSWVAWLQQFQSWKKSKRSMAHDVKCKGRISSYFWLLAVFQNSPGILSSRIQHSRFTVFTLRCLGSVIILKSQFWIASFIMDVEAKILPLASEIRVEWDLSENIMTIWILFLTNLKWQFTLK